MRVKPIFKQLYGLATFLPGIQLQLRGTGGTDTARYCYAVWLRHLTLAHEQGLAGIPRVVAELGPGDSIGIGLAALLSGAEQYHAFDVVQYADLQRNMTVFADLVELFQQRADIPGSDEFPDLQPALTSYKFPYQSLPDGHLLEALRADRINRLRYSIENPSDEESLVRYQAPWYGAHLLQPASVDMIYSQAVMEHVDDLPGTYRAMYEWLKPNGFMSHQIDYRSHDTAQQWNGHWTHSDFAWKMIRGKRPYLLNREPHSTHTRLLQQNGFQVVYEQLAPAPSKLSRTQLAPRFRTLLDSDLTTSSALIQARKVSA